MVKQEKILVERVSKLLAFTEWECKIFTGGPLRDSAPPSSLLWFSWPGWLAVVGRSEAEGVKESRVYFKSEWQPALKCIRSGSAPYCLPPEGCLSFSFSLKINNIWTKKKRIRSHPVCWRHCRGIRFDPRWLPPLGGRLLKASSGGDRRKTNGTEEMFQHGSEGEQNCSWQGERGSNYRHSATLVRGLIKEKIHACSSTANARLALWPSATPFFVPSSSSSSSHSVLSSSEFPFVPVSLFLPPNSPDRTT